MPQGHKKPAHLPQHDPALDWADSGRSAAKRPTLAEAERDLDNPAVQPVQPKDTAFLFAAGEMSRA